MFLVTGFTNGNIELYVYCDFEDAGTLFLNQNTSQCQCVDSEKYLFANQCVDCPVDNCLQCESAIACKTCDEANGYVLNQQTSLCEEEGEEEGSEGLLTYQIALIAIGGVAVVGGVAAAGTYELIQFILV